MSEFFSAAATAKAKEKGGLARYRSYKKGTYFDKISERYNFVDTFSLECLHVPLDMEKIKYYREHPQEQIPITPSSPDGHIVLLPHEEAYYADQGFDHIIVPLQLRVKRFRFVSNEDLQAWEEESKEEDEEEGISPIGSMNSIEGQTPVREILEKTGEAGLIHEALSSRDKQVREMTTPDGTFLASDPSFYHDYQEDFTLVGPCLRYDCPVCYGPITHLDKPIWYILGLHPDHEDVIKLRLQKGKEEKLRYLTKLAKLSQISFTLSQISDSMEVLDSPNLDNYYDSLQ